jgi:hypothetical protein
MGFGLDALGGAGGGATDLSSKSGIGTGGEQTSGVSVPIAIGSGSGGRGSIFNFAGRGGKIDASQTNKQDGVSAVPNDPLDLAKSSTKTVVWAIAGVGLIAALIMFLPKRK